MPHARPLFTLQRAEPINLTRELRPHALHLVQQFANAVVIRPISEQKAIGRLLSTMACGAKFIVHGTHDHRLFVARTAPATGRPRRHSATSRRASHLPRSLTSHNAPSCPTWLEKRRVCRFSESTSADARAPDAC
jgi:hypothetical protein